MARVTKEYSYPQTYFLEPEALKHFGIKARTYKRWLDDGIEIPGRYKVKGANYYVLEPHQFHLWLINTRIEPATKQNKFHNRKPKSLKGGKARDDVPGDVESIQLSNPSLGVRSSGTNKSSNGLAI